MECGDTQYTETHLQPLCKLDEHGGPRGGHLRRRGPPRLGGTPLLHTAAGDSDITTRRRTAVWVVLTSKVMAFRERKQSRIYKKSKKTKKAARTTGLLQIINRLRQRPFDASSPFDTTRGENNFRTNDRSRASPLVIDAISKRQN